MKLWVDRIKWGLIATMALGGPILGILVFNLASSYEKERVLALFGEYVSEQQSLLQKEVNSVVEELYDLRPYFQLQDEVSREEFRALTQDTLGRHPVIQSLEWVPRITGSQRKAHESQARKEGLAGYQILALRQNGDLTPAPLLAEYYPVFYVEPLEPNRRSVGLDLASEKVRRMAMVEAMTLGKLVLSDPIDPIREAQEVEPSKAVLAMLPVQRHYSKEPPPGDQKPAGFVVMVIRVSDLLAQLSLLRQTGRTAQMRFRLVDEELQGESAIMAASLDWDSGGAPVKWESDRSINAFGQRWRLVGRPTEKFLSDHLTRQPMILGWVAFLLWELLGGSMLAVVQQSHTLDQRRQKRILDAVFHSMNEGVVVADRQGKFLLFNDAAQRILGIGPMDIDLTEWAKTYGCYYPDTATPYPSERLPLARALNGEQTDEEIFIRNSKTAHGVWISINGMPMKDERGILAGGVVSFRDISARKQAEIDLRESLRQLGDMKYALDQAAIVSITDAQGNIFYVNSKFCEVTGYKLEELLGQNLRILNSGYHPEAFFREMWETISKGKVWRNRICNRAQNGKQYWVDATIVPFLDDSGQPERYLAIHTDVTEEKKQEETIRRLSNAVEQTADTVFITNREGVIEYVNPAFELTTGYSREEALGETPRILKSGKHPPEYYQKLWKTVLAGEVHRSTGLNRKKNGEFYHSEQTITPIRDADGRVTHFVSVVKDVTERIRRQEREIELQYASMVQQKLYPSQPPVLPGFDIAGAVFPAEATCGDCYDYIHMPGNRLGIAIGDVCGHGLGPALIMAATRAYLRSLARTSPDIGDIFSRINQSLYEDLEDQRYVTFLLAQIDIASRRVVYANAGHPPGYLLDRDGAVKAVLSGNGLPLGMFEDADYSVSESHALEPGDTVVLLTDGITECESPDGRAFEAEGALEVIRAHHDKPASEIVRCVHRATQEFTGGMPQVDDVTIVIVKVGNAA